MDVTRALLDVERPVGVPYVELGHEFPFSFGRLGRGRDEGRLQRTEARALRGLLELPAPRMEIVLSGALAEADDGGMSEVAQL